MSRAAPKECWRDLVILAVIGSFAAVMLFWGLGRKYLWQDEAATALLGDRLLQFGKPLAYDGKNLITIDYTAAEDFNTIEQRASDPKGAIAAYMRRGDFKSDTAWIYQPWGQFAVAAMALKIFGRDSAGLRLPFAAASLLTVFLTYYLVRRSTGRRLIAALAAALLASNSYWLLHGRQCRYYALSGLCLVLTMIAFARWRRGERWGAALFVFAGWCWFQVDYGTVLPVSGVLYAYALLAEPKRRLETFLAGTAFAVAIAPFGLYYGLFNRLAVPSYSLAERFFGHLFNLNQYILPVAVFGIAAALLMVRRRALPEDEKRLVTTALWIVPILFFWVTMVTPLAFLRYFMIICPIGAFLAAWTFARGSEWLWKRDSWQASVTACALASFLAVSPWLSLPAGLLVPKAYRFETGGAVRAELSRVVSEVFGHDPDPNRVVVEWLKANAAPEDEILINYEDLPLAFYLPNPIRGGIGAFRVLDDAKSAPKYAVIRSSVPFVFGPLFAKELERYQWNRIDLSAPDVVWGNNPDPDAHQWDLAKPGNLYIARRVEQKRAEGF